MSNVSHALLGDNMLYFGFKQDMDSVETAASQHLEKVSENYWRTREQMGGVRRGFYLFPEVPIELPGFADCMAVARMHESDFDRMVEGPNIEAKIQQAMEMYEKHIITLDIIGKSVSMDAELPAVLRKPEAPYHHSMIISWETKNSPFVRFMEDLWVHEPWLVHERAFDMESQTHSVAERPDIAYIIVGELAEMPPEGVPHKHRVVYTPNASDIFERPHGMGMGGVNLGHFILGEGTVITEHDEDGKPMYDVDLAAETCEDGHPL